MYDTRNINGHPSPTRPDDCRACGQALCRSGGVWRCGTCGLRALTSVPVAALAEEAPTPVARFHHVAHANTTHAVTNHTALRQKKRRQE